MHYSIKRQHGTTSQERGDPWKVWCPYQASWLCILHNLHPTEIEQPTSLVQSTPKRHSSHLPSPMVVWGHFSPIWFRCPNVGFDMYHITMINQGWSFDVSMYSISRLCKRRFEYYFFEFYHLSPWRYPNIYIYIYNFDLNKQTSRL